MEKTKQDIFNLTKARVDFYVNEIREKDNEWILEDIEAWGDYVNGVYYTMWNNGMITKEDYQEIVSIARDGFAILYKEIQRHESRGSRGDLTAMGG